MSSVLDAIKRAVDDTFGAGTADATANFNIAVATAKVESGLNPQAVGDGSYGLFQLQRGGELGNMSIQQAFDPYQNAMRALSEFKHVEQIHPGLLKSDPGELAYEAQRPDPRKKSQYIAKIRAALGGGNPADAGTNNVSSNSGSSSDSSSSSGDDLGAKVAKFGGMAGLFVTGVVIIGIGILLSLKHKTETT